MTESLAAIGRSVGKVDTDSGGLARYSLKLHVPPGIRHGTEPELSLEYCQAGPNGSLGTGWALGGISCIRKAPSNLAYDGVNPSPADYDPSQPKLFIDGVELLNIDGRYYGQDTRYTTEVDQSGRIFTSLGTGFLAVDSTGGRSEYGTTADSYIKESGKETAREWRLKRISDYHGNTITYDYLVNPRPGSSGAVDDNTCYLSSIRYTSNSRTGFKGNRLVKFEYSSRPDVRVQNFQGTKSVWASRLKSISFGVIQDDEVLLNRSYDLEYSISAFTGDSCLVSVTETGSDGFKRVKLLPSEFSYSTPGLPPEGLFRSHSHQSTGLRATTNNVALFPMNISGRCLSDLACIRRDNVTNELSIKTYLAVRDANGNISWTPSDGTGWEAKLPVIDIRNGFPSILAPDLSNDGRSDLVIPYRDKDNCLSFSISQSVGTGFQSYKGKSTNLRWIEGSKFIAVENPGRGPSIIRIAAIRNKLTFTNFPGFIQNSEVGLRDAVVTPTEHDNIGTIDWIQLTRTGTEARVLVRIWSADLGFGKSQIKATPFTIQSNGTVQEGVPSLLGPPSKSTKIKYSVISCDINADGAQDIVLASAEYGVTEMNLTFRIYLGDGTGAFTFHGESIPQKKRCPIPMKSSEYGQFYVTNLNGSNYPSLSYVYQTKYGNSFQCISVDGRSDGLLCDATLHELAKDLPSKDMQVIAADLNGNGMGDWLLYTLTGGTPIVIPVYNQAQPVEMLVSARDPMGLRTDLSYGTISDPDVYSAGVGWKNYKTTETDSYPVIAAPNYVVTALEHRNDPDITSVPYLASIKKTYARARVNTLGRGWQGFEEIITTNTVDNIVTSEKYFQTWPLTSYKRQIDTKTMEGQRLKSLKTNLWSKSRDLGPWKIHRVSTTLEQEEMFEQDAVVRINATRFEYDDQGNITLQAQSESQHGQLVFQTWKRCAYISIDNVTGVLVAQKISANGNNLNMASYEPGDISLDIYENEAQRAVLSNILTWSTDVGQFAKKSYKFDRYGREIQSVDAAGLLKLTYFDELFQTFPVKITEQGQGVSNTQLMAYDIHSGYETARLETNGLLECYKIDCFGRTSETRTRAAEPSTSSVKGTDFLTRYVSEPSFHEILDRSHFNPSRKITFERVNSISGKAHIGTRVITYTKDDVEGEHDLMEYVDCVKQVYKRSIRNGSSIDKVWTHWTYSSSGHALFESFPTRLTDATGLDWEPGPDFGISSTFDALGRPLTRVKPAHSGQTGWIVTSMTYLDGGARLRETTRSSNSPSPPFPEVTKRMQVEYRKIMVGKEERIIESIDENGQRSTFEYDAAGRLVKCIDPAGQVELRAYSSLGEITTLDNTYQNVYKSTDIPAVTYVYDVAGLLSQEKNAAGETIKYERDAKGRTTLKVGYDGRTVKCVYDSNGVEALSSVTIFAKGVANAFETLLQFKYDINGRVNERSLTLADGTIYTILTEYDWQGQTIRKLLPGGVSLSCDYRGSETVTNKLSGGSSAMWTLQSETVKSSPYGRPEALKIQGSGIETFTNSWTFDKQGFPMSHSLDVQKKSLVDERYIYNEMDQLGRKHDFLSGETTDFTYEGRRLSSTQLGSGTKFSYAYDSTGNLTHKRGTALAYSPGRVMGTKDNMPLFDISYDKAGRTIQRLTSGSELALTYDAFGSLRSVLDAKRNQHIELLADHNGEMLQRSHSDGSSDLYISDDVSVHIQADRSKLIRYHLFNQNDADNQEQVVATISTAYESTQSQRPLSSVRKASIQFTNTKGNVSHVFKAEDAVLNEKFDYDDFGYFDNANSNSLDSDSKQRTYEGTLYDNVSGLLNFGGRWYDPLVGRFTVPDDILDIGSFLRPDGMNRYAFECNDPINNTDPTGHWTWSAVLMTVASVALIASGVVLTIATAGTAGILIGAAAGALISSGVAGFLYSIKNQDEDNAGKVWGGFFTTLLLNAAIGALAGGASALAAPARIASMSARLFIKASVGGATSVLGKAAERGVDNLFYGTHHDLFEGAAVSFGIGAAVGLVFGAVGERQPSSSSPNQLLGINKFNGPFKLRTFTGIRTILEPKPTNPWADITKQTVKLTVKTILKPTSKIAMWGAKELGYVSVAGSLARQGYDRLRS